VRIRDAHGKINPASDSLVRSNLTKGLSVKNILSRDDLNADYTRIERKDKKENTDQN